MKTLRWILGTIVLIGLVVLIIMMPLRSLFFIEVYEHLGFVDRAGSILILAALMILYRILRGPTAADKIVAIDIFGILVIGFTAILTIASGRSWYIDIGIAWGLQSFIGALAFSKYLEGKAYDA
jgi:multicomponent Na+:H+ antiporter subunit F